MPLLIYLFPPKCPHCMKAPEAYYLSLPHSLVPMAKAAGLRQALWRPCENGIGKAFQMIEILEYGIKLLKSEPVVFREYEPADGWGNYDTFLGWLEEYLKVCREMPQAEIITTQ